MKCKIWGRSCSLFTVITNSAHSTLPTCPSGAQYLKLKTHDCNDLKSKQSIYVKRYLSTSIKIQVLIQVLQKCNPVSFLNLMNLGQTAQVVAYNTNGISAFPTYLKQRQWKFDLKSSHNEPWNELSIVTGWQCHR